MSCRLSVKVDVYNYEHFEVPAPVYAYVKQLEQVVKYGDKKWLAALYPERFGDPFAEALRVANQTLDSNLNCVATENGQINYEDKK